VVTWTDGHHVERDDTTAFAKAPASLAEALRAEADGHDDWISRDFIVCFVSSCPSAFSLLRRTAGALAEAVVVSRGP
jgi:hypothetical protein